ncbi:MAG TPA: hypothetical protein VNO55_09410, partial [Polyangia bacterium]|nr:hypothetical protein [Polyangia bacterium]
SPDGGAPRAGTGGSISASSGGSGGGAAVDAAGIGGGGGGSDGSTASGAGGAVSGGGGGATAGTGGSNATDGGNASAPGPFTCSEMIGLWVMSQWWGPFEKVVDSAAWQYIFVHHGYLETWADPTSAYWTTKAISPCGSKADSPDRIIFLPFSLTLKTEEEWQSNLVKVVDAIKMRFKDVKRIEFITTLRSPGNQPCANDSDPNVVVPPAVDQAIQAVADASGGLVTVGPKIELANCNWWVGGTDLTAAGNTGVGELYGAYYKNHP